MTGRISTVLHATTDQERTNELMRWILEDLYGRRILAPTQLYGIRGTIVT
jgi:hypothetical protein